jgi:hypothetical protein
MVCRVDKTGLHFAMPNTPSAGRFLYVPLSQIHGCELERLSTDGKASSLLQVNVRVPREDRQTRHIRSFSLMLQGSGAVDLMDAMRRSMRYASVTYRVASTNSFKSDDSNKGTLPRLRVSEKGQYVWSVPGFWVASRHPGSPGPEEDEDVDPAVTVPQAPPADAEPDRPREVRRSPCRSGTGGAYCHGAPYDRAQATPRGSSSTSSASCVVPRIETHIFGRLFTAAFSQFFLSGKALLRRNGATYFF